MGVVSFWAVAGAVSREKSVATKCGVDGSRAVDVAIVLDRFSVVVVWRERNGRGGRAECDSASSELLIRSCRCGGVRGRMDRG